MKPWSLLQDILLTEAAATQPRHWGCVGARLGRGADECSSRFAELLERGLPELPSPQKPPQAQSATRKNAGRTAPNYHPKITDTGQKPRKPLEKQTLTDRKSRQNPSFSMPSLSSPCPAVPHSADRSIAQRLGRKSPLKSEMDLESAIFLGDSNSDIPDLTSTTSPTLFLEMQMAADLATAQTQSAAQVIKENSSVIVPEDKDHVDLDRFFDFGDCEENQVTAQEPESTDSPSDMATTSVSSLGSLAIGKLHLLEPIILANRTVKLSDPIIEHNNESSNQDLSVSQFFNSPEKLCAPTDDIYLSSLFKSPAKAISNGLPEERNSLTVVPLNGAQIISKPHLSSLDLSPYTRKSDRNPYISTFDTSPAIQKNSGVSQENPYLKSFFNSPNKDVFSHKNSGSLILTNPKPRTPRLVQNGSSAIKPFIPNTIYSGIDDLLGFPTLDYIKSSVRKLESGAINIFNEEDSDSDGDAYQDNGTSIAFTSIISSPSTCEDSDLENDVLKVAGTDIPRQEFDDLFLENLQATRTEFSSTMMLETQGNIDWVSTRVKVFSWDQIVKIKLQMSQSVQLGIQSYAIATELKGANHTDSMYYRSQLVIVF